MKKSAKQPQAKKKTGSGAAKSGSVKWSIEKSTTAVRKAGAFPISGDTCGTCSK